MVYTHIQRKNLVLLFKNMAEHLHVADAGVLVEAVSMHQMLEKMLAACRSSLGSWLCLGPAADPGRTHA